MAALCLQRHKEIAEPATKGTPLHHNLNPQTAWFSNNYGFPSTRPSYCGPWHPPHFSASSDSGSYCHPQAAPYPLLPDLAADSCVNPTVFILSIRRAKNDLFGQGAQVVLGSTHSRSPCPVNALKEFLEARLPSPEPLFITKDASSLLKEAFVSVVRRALETPGLNPALYAAHSFRWSPPQL